MLHSCTGYTGSNSKEDMNDEWRRVSQKEVMTYFKILSICWRD